MNGSRNQHRGFKPALVTSANPIRPFVHFRSCDCLVGWKRSTGIKMLAPISATESHTLQLAVPLNLLVPRLVWDNHFKVGSGRGGPFYLGCGRPLHKLGSPLALDSVTGI